MEERPCSTTSHTQQQHTANGRAVQRVLEEVREVRVTPSIQFAADSKKSVEVRLYPPKLLNLRDTTATPTELLGTNISGDRFP